MNLNQLLEWAKDSGIDVDVAKRELDNLMKQNDIYRNTLYWKEKQVMHLEDIIDIAIFAALKKC